MVFMCNSIATVSCYCYKSPVAVVVRIKSSASFDLIPCRYITKVLHTPYKLFMIKILLFVLVKMKHKQIK